MKTRTGFLTVAFAMATMFASAAYATDLTTGTLIAGPDDYPYCVALNAGKKTVTVHVEMRGFDGSLVAGDDQTIDPTKVRSVLTGGPLAFYCTFSGRFSKSSIRGTAQVLDGSHTLAVLQAQ